MGLPERTLVNAALALTLPLDDWQFWVATLISLIALYAVLRMLLPRSWFPGGKKTPSRKVTLTIDGKPPERSR